ncbi:hypothetical protein BDV3_003408 [Batrachochytrium dendrobatidis]
MASNNPSQYNENSNRPAIQSIPLGMPIPPHTHHAISVALPIWSDNVGYEEGDSKVIAAMQGGYPRFVFTPLVKKLFEICNDRFAKVYEDCLVFSNRESAEACRHFIYSRISNPDMNIRIVELSVASESHSYHSAKEHSTLLISDVNVSTHPTLHIVIFPFNFAYIAKQFWQHTGEGISSRFAAHCLRLMEVAECELSLATPHQSNSTTGEKCDSDPYGMQAMQRSLPKIQYDVTKYETDTFVEERYGRNLDTHMADTTKTMIRRRIAAIVCNHFEKPDVESSDSTVVSTCDASVSEDNVFLYPCGMSAIYNIHRVILKLKPGLKSVQFGFPYTDTLKIQEKFGPGCHFLGHGNASDMEKLEKLLVSEKISAIFCEFPSNPLLQSHDLSLLWSLAQKHDCFLIVDETIGNFANVRVLPFADLIVSSLTKLFSGDSNVMGGSATLNPRSNHYPQLFAMVSGMYQDRFWCEDAIFLERNSRSFFERNQIINQNAEIICDFLHHHPKVQTVLYPKYVDTSTYTKFVCNKDMPGYGGLFSLILKLEQDAIRFYDAIEIYKGPSLGTNFTLACPYTILAHYTELEWAASYNVPKKLVRVSVGTEPSSVLLKIFSKAMDAI